MSQKSYFFVFTNGGEACTLNGHPGVQLVGADGKPLPHEVAHGGGYTIGEDPPKVDVLLQRGGRAWFAVSTTVACGADGGDRPSSTSGLLVIPPDDTRQLRVDASVEYCPDQSHLTVSTVQASKDAFSA